MKIKSLFLILICIPILMIGCMAGDPVPDDLYTKNVYPGGDSVYSVGSDGLTYADGWFDNGHFSQVEVAGDSYVGGDLSVVGTLTVGGVSFAPGEYDYLHFRASGKYHGSSVVQSAWGGITLLTNYIYVVPYYCPQAVTVTRMAIQARTVAAGAECIIGIYEDNGNCSPEGSPLVYGSAKIDCSAGVGIKEVTGLSINLSGSTLYWLAIITNNASWQTNYNSATSMPSLIGWDTTTLDAVENIGYRTSRAYGALPDPHPALVTFGLTAGTPKICIYW